MRWKGLAGALSFEYEERPGTIVQQVRAVPKSSTDNVLSS